MRQFCNVCNAKVIDGFCKCGNHAVPDTRHLDTAISIFKGTPASKRAPRKAQVTITVEWHKGAYTLQSNGRIVEAGDGTADYANERGKARAVSIRALGKTCLVECV